MTLYGIVSLRGNAVVEGGFADEEAAEAARRDIAADTEDLADLEVEELCDDHPSNAAFNCPCPHHDD